MAVFEPEAEGIVLDAEQTGGDIVGRSPWELAGRRLMRNKLALAALALFILIVAVSLSAPPLYRLAISLATVLLARPTDKPLKIGFITLTAGSLWIPLVIIGLVYVPYVFRPIRGQVLSLREKEFVEAAVAQGASSFRLVFREILPHVISTVVVLLPLMIATTILTEAALSYLSIGVQPPKASWGPIIEDGQALLYTRPWSPIAPGIMIVLTVLALNVLGDGLRDALDPRSKVRMK